MPNQPQVFGAPPTEQESRFRQCRPLTMSQFEVESEIAMPSMLVQIQRYRWDQPVNDGFFNPQVCYLDLALLHRSRPQLVSLRQGGHYSAFTPIGDSVFFPAGAEVRSRIPAVEHRVLSCMFDPSELECYLDLQWSRHAVSACFDIRNPHIRQGLARLAEEMQAPGFASQFLVQSIVCALVVELVRYCRGIRTGARETGSRLTARQLRALDERMENLSGATPSLDALAAVCGLSSRHLTRAYKNTTGKTLGEFIADARISQAKSLLSKSDVLIKSVAYNTGFQSPAAFAAAFRKATGWSPRQFRKEVLGYIE
jgi:AraC family transcriptional regulator